MWIRMAIAAGNVVSHNGGLTLFLLRICHITKQKTAEKAIKNVSKSQEWGRERVELLELSLEKTAMQSGVLKIDKTV